MENTAMSLQHSNSLPNESEVYTVADASALNKFKNHLRNITQELDQLSRVYPNALEVVQIKHEVSVLLAELRTHGLLPEGIRIY